jgi:hypothetical protein
MRFVAFKCPANFDLVCGWHLVFFGGVTQMVARLELSDV